MVAFIISKICAHFLTIHESCSQAALLPQKILTTPKSESQGLTSSRPKISLMHKKKLYKSNFSEVKTGIGNDWSICYSLLKNYAV